MTSAAPLLPELSLEDWAEMAEDEAGELVDGQLVEEEVTDPVHDDIASWLNAILRPWVVARGGFIMGPDVKFVLGPGHGRKPDLAVFFGGGAVPPRRGLVRVPSDIMVEIISRDPQDVRRDRIEKANEYATFGVRFYWLIDPDARTLEIYELQPPGRYLRVVGASQGVVDVPACAGLRLDLDALWKEIDRLGPETPAPAPRPKTRKKAKR